MTDKKLPAELRPDGVREVAELRGGTTGREPIAMLAEALAVMGGNMGQVDDLTLEIDANAESTRIRFRAYRTKAAP